MRLEVVTSGSTSVHWSALIASPSLFDEIHAKQRDDPKLARIFERIQKGKRKEDDGFEVSSDDSLRFRGRWCVPTSDDTLVTRILDEVHSTPYSIHPGGDKMYKDLRTTFWWPGMKSDVAALSGQVFGLFEG